MSPDFPPVEVSFQRLKKSPKYRSDVFKLLEDRWDFWSVVKDFPRHPIPVVLKIWTAIPDYWTVSTRGTEDERSRTISILALGITIPMERHTTELIARDGLEYAGREYAAGVLQEPREWWKYSSTGELQLTKTKDTACPRT